MLIKGLLSRLKGNTNRNGVEIISSSWCLNYLHQITIFSILDSVLKTRGVDPINPPGSTLKMSEVQRLSCNNTELGFLRKGVFGEVSLYFLTNDDLITAMPRIQTVGSCKMFYISLFLVTAIVFVMLDVIMLKKVLYPLFSSNIGAIMNEDPKMGAAAVFWLFYVSGIIWFASLPAVAAGQPGQAFLTGCILGLLAYGTYEFTNFATLRGWSLQMVAVDVTWGSVLTGTSAWAGVLVVQAFSS